MTHNLKRRFSPYIQRQKMLGLNNDTGGENKTTAKDQATGKVEKTEK